MAELIECECCNKQISKDSVICINCGHPINAVESTLFFSYEYNDNSPVVYKEEADKLDVLQKVNKVNLNGEIYAITDYIYNANSEVVHIILNDI